MGKRSLHAASILLIGVSAFCVYLLLSNWNYRARDQADGLEIPANRINFSNSNILDGAMPTIDDSAIILKGLNGYVDYIEIEWDFTLDSLILMAYYNWYPGQSFTEPRSFRPQYNQTEGRLFVEIGRVTSDLRIDILPNGKLPAIRLSRMVKHPLGIQFDPVWAAACVFCAYVAAYAIYLIRRKSDKVIAYWASFRKYTYLLENLVRRDITVKYRRSVLGILWSVLNPLLMMVVISTVFQQLFRIQVDNFPLYYLTGSLIFNFVSEATTGAMTSIISNGALIRKVYVPKYVFPLQKCLFSLVNMLLSLVAVLFMYLVLRFQLPITFPLVIIPMFYAFVFSVGFGMILATITVFFRDISHLYSVWMTVWMYLTPIIYPIDILPNLIRSLVQLNPLYHYVDYFRKVAMHGIIPGFRENIICCLFAFSFVFVGIIVFKRKQDRFILYI